MSHLSTLLSNAKGYTSRIGDNTLCLINNASISVAHVGGDFVYNEADVLLIIGGTYREDKVILKQSCDDGGYLAFVVTQQGVNNMYPEQLRLAIKNKKLNEMGVVKIDALDNLAESYFDNLEDALDCHL
ncbi:hypothetical protein [Photobacterium kishitanii]|uniref:Uncharacterized protein n=1 Tax=Photobacterium kishitanii TaxID=318456 RepID=A0A2T3KKS9_9GAMM|nr:hypothetical protein [Photobacterium kishitanii]PSV00325.1 hypothetical protein C9J27_04155 [Photobacterium kishitanii]